MSLIRYNTAYNPWSLIDRLQRDLSITPPVSNDDGANYDREAVTSDWAPSVDIRENDKSYTVLADVPGVNPKDIQVNMEKGVLTIKGEREKEKKTERNGYKRIEREYGVFYRRFSMPDGVDQEKIEANAENGVLTINIPKQEATLSRRINVKH